MCAERQNGASEVSEAPAAQGTESDGHIRFWVMQWRPAYQASRSQPWKPPQLSRHHTLQSPRKESSAEIVVLCQPPQRFGASSSLAQRPLRDLDISSSNGDAFMLATRPRTRITNLLERAVTKGGPEYIQCTSCHRFGK